MDISEFEKIKQEPTTCDMLKWIIKEHIESGVTRQTMINIVKNIYDEMKKGR